MINISKQAVFYNPGHTEYIKNGENVLVSIKPGHKENSFVFKILDRFWINKSAKKGLKTASTDPRANVPIACGAINLSNQDHQLGLGPRYHISLNSSYNGYRDAYFEHISIGMDLIHRNLLDYLQKLNQITGHYMPF